MNPAEAPPIGVPGDVAAVALPVWANIIALVLAFLSPLVLIVLWRGDLIRPGSFGRWRRRDLSAWPWWFWLLCSLGTWFAMAIGAGAAISVLSVLQAGRSQALEIGIMYIAGAIAGAATAGLLLKVVQEEVQDPAASGMAMRFGWREIRLGLLATALTIPVLQATSIVSLMLYQVVMRREPEVIAHELLTIMHQEPASAGLVLIIIGAVVGAPIVEEFIFRVYLQSALARLFRRTWPAVLAASAIFTLTHVGSGVQLAHWHTLPVLFVLGTSMGLAYEWTRRPIVPIIMHMIFNGYNVVLVIVGLG